KQSGSNELTAPGAVVGTPSYMAPEQARGHSGGVNPLADVWSIGAILYEMLTGRPPFKGVTLLETLDQVRRQEPVPPKRLNDSLPRDLETVCLKCLQKDRAQRYATAGALAEDLKRYRAGEPIKARPVSRGERVWRWCRRNPRVASLLTVLALVLAGALVGVTVLWRQARAHRP